MSTDTEKDRKNTDKEQGNTKHEAPRSVNYRATKNKNNIGTTALEFWVDYDSPIWIWALLSMNCGLYSKFSSILQVWLAGF